MNFLYYRAGAFCYLILVGPWLLIGLCFYLRTGYKGDGWAILGCAIWGAFFIGWLRGFLVHISESELKYRDGYYKTTIIPRADIISVRHGTEKVPLRFGGAMRFSALVVKYKVGKSTRTLCINPLPFDVHITTIMNILNKSKE